MAVSTTAQQQLRTAADLAWDARWNFTWDMNNDGVVTISDAWLWLKWVFFAPGDLLLLLLMKFGTGAAVSLQINPTDLSGWISGLLSAAIWLVFIAIANERAYAIAKA
jgi:hypothetical protein